MASKGENSAELEDAHRDARAAPRITLLLRVGKLVLDGGEYPCVLRDASSSGIRIRLFCPLTPSTQYQIELGSGARFTLEPVWERDGEAGFRFREGPVDLGLMLEEPRQFPKRHLRLRLRRPVPIRIMADGSRLPGLLHDISQQGARVETGPGLALQQPVVLELPARPAIRARLRWRRQADHGLVFARGFQLGELAALITQLQTLTTDQPAIPAQIG